MFLARPADARLEEWIAEVARRGASRGGDVLTVHGLSGSGASTSVARALTRHAFFRVDLGTATKSTMVTERLRAVPPRAARVFLDQVHHPDAARAPLGRWLRRREASVVIAARGPLHLEGEVRVPLGLFDLEASRTFLDEQLRHLGVHPLPDTSALLPFLDGWTPILRSAALAVRLLGVEKVVERGAWGDASTERRLAESVGALGRDALALLGALALARAPVEAEDAMRLVERGAVSLDLLLDRGLLVCDEGLVRVPEPIAFFVRGRGTRHREEVRRAHRTHALLVLAGGERARALHRTDPIGAGKALQRLRGELVGLSLDEDPRTAVRAALALEPLMLGHLTRREVLSLYERARRAAASLDAAAQAGIALALCRTWIGRGDHENAKDLLLGTDALSAQPISAAYRAIYLGHIAAWRGALAQAGSHLDEAARHLEGVEPSDAAENAREDLLLQRIFLAHRGGHLDETELLSRRAATLASQRPSPRLGALARRFVAEVMMLRGAPALAVPLLRKTQEELTAYGDHTGALYQSSRVIEALRAAGETGRAEHEARTTSLLAARAEEGTLELTVLEALDGRTVSPARIAELMWRVQIPSLRDRVERWLAEQPPSGELPVLRLDHATSSAALEGRTLGLARRSTLWRILVALAHAHKDTSSRTTSALFTAGWPGDRAEPASQKKRVQTAIWTLRRELLGAHLTTLPQGYQLASDLRIVEDRGAPPSLQGSPAQDGEP